LIGTLQPNTCTDRQFLKKVHHLANVEIKKIPSTSTSANGTDNINTDLIREGPRIMVLTGQVKTYFRWHQIYITRISEEHSMVDQEINKIELNTVLTNLLKTARRNTGPNSGLLIS